MLVCDVELGHQSGRPWRSNPGLRALTGRPGKARARGAVLLTCVLGPRVRAGAVETTSAKPNLDPARDFQRSGVPALMGQKSFDSQLVLNGLNPV